MWSNVYHGLRIQWSDPTTWVVFGAALGIVTLLAWLLTAKRGWPRGPTSAAASWIAFFVASTWRIQHEPPSWSGVGQFLGRLVDPGAWAHGAAELALAGPFVLANLAVGVPLGLLLLLAARPRWLAGPSLVLLVLGVESAQSFAYGGSIADVLANVLGGAIGMVLGAAGIEAKRYLSTRRRQES